MSAQPHGATACICAVQTPVQARLRAAAGREAGVPPNRACLEAMLVDLGFRVTASRLTTSDRLSRLVVHAERIDGVQDASPASA